MQSSVVESTFRYQPVSQSASIRPAFVSMIGVTVMVPQTTAESSVAFEEINRCRGMFT